EPVDEKQQERRRSSTSSRGWGSAARGSAEDVEVAGAGADVDLPVPHRRGGLDAAAELDLPEQRRVDAGVAHVVGVEEAAAVADEQDVVDDDRAAPDRAGDVLLPPHLAGVAVDADEAAAVRPEVEDVAVDAGRAVDAALQRPGVVDLPHDRVVRLARVELRDLADVPGALQVPVVLAGDVEHPL